MMMMMMMMTMMMMQINSYTELLRKAVTGYTDN